MEINNEYSKDDISEMAREIRPILFGTLFTSIKFYVLIFLICILYFIVTIVLRVSEAANIVSFVIWMSLSYLLIVLVAIVIFYCTLVFTIEKIIKDRWNKVIINDDNIQVKNNTYSFLDVSRIDFSANYIIVIIKNKLICLKRNEELDEFMINKLKNLYK